MFAEEYQRKFKNAEALLGEKFMQVATTVHFDWLAIIMFYGAVHLAERKFALWKKPHHSKGHSERNNLVRKLKNGSSIVGDLLLLYNASLDARYENINLTYEDILVLKESYEKIKNILID